MLIALVMALLAVPVFSQEIALVNPGFEQPAENDATLPAGWQRWQATPAQVYLDEQAPYEGTRCAALRPNPPGKGTVVLKQYFTDYEPGVEYEVVFAGRTNGVAAGRLNIINWTAIEDKRGRKDIYPGTVVTFDNTDWQVFGTTFIAPKQTGQQLYLELSHGRFAPPEAIISWDDFSIRPVLPAHRKLLKLTGESDHALYTTLVNTRFEIGSRCDMADYFLDDAVHHAGMSEDLARPLRRRIEDVRDGFDAVIAQWTRRHAEVYGVDLAVTRLTDEDFAARELLLRSTLADGQLALENAVATATQALQSLEADARRAAGELLIPPQTASEVTTDTLGDRFHRIVSWHGYMTDESYVHRAMWDLPATIVQGYLWRESNWPLRDRFFEANTPRTFPYFERVVAEGWPDLTALRESVQREMAVLGDRPGFRGFEIDEPSIMDKHVATDEGYAAFEQYLAGKYSGEERAALGIADTTGWTIADEVETDAHRVLWMEWQRFKIDLMTRRLVEAEEFIKSQPGEPVLLPVIQQFLPSEPQRASWVSVPAALDWIAMDPYSGGAPSEAFEMDLLRSNSKGPTYLVVGTCYDPTAGRFNKDMCISLAHADGLWVWCWVYMSKYRAPGFLANGWERQYRHLWKPGMWEAAREVFGKIDAAEEYLVHTTSGTPIAVVFSERTGIFDSGEKPGNDLIRHFHIIQGLYQGLHQTHLAEEAVFAEALTAESLADRQVLLLADARLLNNREVGVIREWVRGGGTLIAMGPTSLCDEWGRPQEDYALADVFGASYQGTIEKPGAIAPGLSNEIALPGDHEADLIEPTTATVTASYAGGQPAVLRNSFGSGTCWLITNAWLGAAYSGSASLKSIDKIYQPGARELLERLCRTGIAGGALPVELWTDCPAAVEMTLRRQGERLIVHLLNYANDTTVSGVSLRVTGDTPARIFDPTRPNDAIPVHDDGDGVRFTVPDFDNHTMFVIQPR